MNMEEPNFVEKPVELRETDEIHSLTVRYRTSFFPYFIIIANSAWLLFIPNLSYSYRGEAQLELFGVVICFTVLLTVFAIGLDRQAMISKITAQGLEVCDVTKASLFAWGVSRKSRSYKWSDIITWQIAEIPPSQIYKKEWRSKGVGIVVTAFKNGVSETFKIGGNLTLLNGRPLTPARFIALVFPLLPDNSVNFADNTKDLLERMRSESWKRINYSYTLGWTLMPILISFLLYKITYILVGFTFAIFLAAIYVQIKSQNKELQKIIDNWKKDPQNLRALDRIKYENPPFQSYEIRVLEGFYKKLSLRYRNSRKTDVFGELFNELIQLKRNANNQKMNAEELQAHLQSRYTKLLAATPL